MVSYLGSLKNVLMMINNGRCIHLRNNILQCLSLHISFIEKYGYIKDEASLNSVIERAKDLIRQEMTNRQHS